MVIPIIESMTHQFDMLENSLKKSSLNIIHKKSLIAFENWKHLLRESEFWIYETIIMRWFST